MIQTTIHKFCNTFNLNKINLDDKSQRIQCYENGKKFVYTLQLITFIIQEIRKIFGNLNTIQKVFYYLHRKLQIFITNLS